MRTDDLVTIIAGALAEHGKGLPSNHLVRDTLDIVKGYIEGRRTLTASCSDLQCTIAHTLQAFDLRTDRKKLLEWFIQGGLVQAWGQPEFDLETTAIVDFYLRTGKLYSKALPMQRDLAERAKRLFETVPA